MIPVIFFILEKFDHHLLPGRCVRDPPTSISAFGFSSLEMLYMKSFVLTFDIEAPFNIDSLKYVEDVLP